MAGCNLCEHWSIRSSQLYRTGGVCFRRPNRFYGYFDHRGDVLALQRNIAYFPSPSFGRAKSDEALIESKLSSLSFPGESQGITIGNGKFASRQKAGIVTFGESRSVFSGVPAWDGADYAPHHLVQ